MVEVPTLEEFFKLDRLRVALHEKEEEIAKLEDQIVAAGGDGKGDGVPRPSLSLSLRGSVLGWRPEFCLTTQDLLRRGAPDPPPSDPPPPLK